LRFGFYSLLQALASAVLLVMLRHMKSHDQAPDIPEPVVTNNTWQTYGLLVGFGLSIPVFFITTYGWVLWVIGRCWCTGCTGGVTANSDTPGSPSTSRRADQRPGAARKIGKCLETTRARHQGSCHGLGLRAWSG
jgi:hypothetical protein